MHTVGKDAGAYESAGALLGGNGLLPEEPHLGEAAGEEAGLAGAESTEWGVFRY